MLSDFFPEVTEFLGTSQGMQPKHVGVRLVVFLVVLYVLLLLVGLMNHWVSTWFKPKAGFVEIPGTSNPMDVFSANTRFNGLLTEVGRQQPAGFSYDMQLSSEDSGYRVSAGERDNSALTDAALAAGQK